MNSICLIGRLTRDPEADQTAGGTAVCRIRLAVPRRARDGQDPGAVFVNVVAYAAQSVSCLAYLHKGRQVAVTGRLEHRQWTAPDGSQRSLHEVVADSVQFLGDPSRNGASTPDADTGSEPESEETEPQPVGAAQY